MADPVKVHYLTRYMDSACGERWPATADKSLVTCLNCKRTRVFKEATGLWAGERETPNVQ